MKVRVLSKRGLLGAVAQRMVTEGDTLSLDALGDLLLADTPVTGWVGGDWNIPSEVVGAHPEAGVDYTVSRWWDGRGWGQTLVGIPLVGLMNEGLGPQVVTGLACRYATGVGDTEFGNETLLDILHTISYVGFVSFEMSLGLGPEGPVVVRAMLGIPYYGLANVLEGVNGKVSDFLSGKVPHLLESWTVNLVLSRWPWPHAQACDRYIVDGLTGASLRHLWLFDVTHTKQTVSCETGLLGVASAWSTSVSECVRRCLRTCRSLSWPDRQYRTDAATVASLGWRRLTDEGVVPPQ